MLCEFPHLAVSTDFHSILLSNPRSPLTFVGPYTISGNMSRYKWSYLQYSYLDRYPFLAAWRASQNLEFLNSLDMTVQGDLALGPCPALFFLAVLTPPRTLYGGFCTPSTTACKSKLLPHISHGPNIASWLLLGPKGVHSCSTPRKEAHPGPGSGFKAI